MWSDQGFQARFAVMGDKSEDAFEQWASIKQIEWERFGFSRPKIKLFWKIPAILRYTPDYVAMGKKPFFAECKGCGRASYVKIKEANLTELEEWNTKLQLWFFIFDSHLGRVSFTDFHTVYNICKESPVGYFQEGHKYFKLPKKLLTWEAFTPKEIINGY